MEVQKLIRLLQMYPPKSDVTVGESQFKFDQVLKIVKPIGNTIFEIEVK
jgi:hypothetical protein